MASLFLLTPGVDASSAKRALLDSSSANCCLRRLRQMPPGALARPRGVMPGTKLPHATAGVLVASPEGAGAEPEAAGVPMKAAEAGGGTPLPGLVGANPEPPEADPEASREPFKAPGAGGGTWGRGLVDGLDCGLAMMLTSPLLKFEGG